MILFEISNGQSKPVKEVDVADSETIIHDVKEKGKEEYREEHGEVILTREGEFYTVYADVEVADNLHYTDQWINGPFETKREAVGSVRAASFK